MPKKKDDIGFNINSFIKGSPEEKDNTLVTPNDGVKALPVKARTRKKSEDNTVDVITPLQPESSMSYIQQNIPYQMAYNETNKQLDDAIMQLDMLGAETLADLQMVRSSKTLKNKYNYINDMTENAVGIINAKLSAIKEKNKTINDINNMEIRRIKDLKMLQQSEEDDNTRIANMYNAFVNTPIGNAVPSLGPSIMDTTLVGAGQAYDRASINGGYMDSTAAWQASLDPAGKRMLYESQGLIETVVYYDEASGNRWYACIDKSTGQPMQGVEVPSNEDIYSLDINVRGNFAKDSHRNVIYPLIVVNGSNGMDAAMNQY